MLKNAKHEKFAQAVALGATGVQAYREHVAEPESKTSTCMVEASKLLAEPNVALRVSELRKKAAGIAEQRHGWSKERLISYLLEVLETPIGELDENHRLTNEITSEWKGGRRGQLMRGHHAEGNEDQGEEPYEVVKVKGISKAEAAKQLSVLCGWNEPEKVEHTGTVTLSLEVQRALEEVL